MYFGVILSNFILAFILINVLYRMQFSIIIATTFLGLYIYQSLSNKKAIKYLSIIAFTWLIIIQTKTLNQYFYNDYKRYENEKTIANDIALNVMKNCDYENKPLLCFLPSDELRGEKYELNIDNGKSVIKWGIDAFSEPQTEITKFINEQGYNFKYITKEEAEKAYEEIYKAGRINEYIIELENVIIVNLKYYDF